MDVYDIMEENLTTNYRSIATIKKLGREFISKMKLIDKEINRINPNKGQWINLSEDDRKKLSALYSLKSQYRSQFDIIIVILNKDDRIVKGFVKDRFEQIGLDDKFFIEDLKNE